MKRDLISIVLGATLLLAAWSLAFIPKEYHLNGQDGALNDQVNYIRTSMHFAETGSLDGGIIYPGLLPDHPKYLYMPGHYVVTGVFFKLFGVGPLQAKLPNLFGYILSCCLVYLLGRRLFDRRTGLLAAIVWALFPANLTYAFTSMAEITTVAASLVFLNAVAWMPTRLRPLALPLLLSLPFLFRENTAVLVIFALALFGFDRVVPWARRIGLSVLASVVILYVLLRWQLDSGKFSIPLSPSTFNYGDALRGPIDTSLAQWMIKWASNGKQLVDMLLPFPHTLQGISVMLVLAMAFVAVIHGVTSCRQTLFPLCASANFLITACLIFFFYEIYGGRLLRPSLFAIPPLSIAVSHWVNTLRLPRHAAILASGAGVIASAVLIYMASLSVTCCDAEDRANLSFVEELGHDDTRLIVAPVRLLPPYCVAHYPVSCALLPANLETFFVLADTHSIGTLILPSTMSADAERILHGIGGLKNSTTELLGLQYVLVRAKSTE